MNGFAAGRLMYLNDLAPTELPAPELFERAGSARTRGQAPLVPGRVPSNTVKRKLPVRALKYPVSENRRHVSHQRCPRS